MELVSTIVLGVGIGVLAQPQLIVRFMTVKSGRELNRALVPGGIFILFMTGVAFVTGALSNVYFWNQHGKVALAMVIDPATGKPNVDKVIPTFIQSAMPEWFGYLFMLALLAAAMSTLSAQFHVIGTAIGRDVYQQVIAKGGHQERTVPIAKAGILIGFVVTVLLSFWLGPGIVAIATALFFGMCASAFLPLFTAALFWKRANKFGAIAGMLAGTFGWLLWVLLVHEKESAALGVAKLLFGRPSILTGTTWAVVDPLVIALPLSTAITIIATLATRPSAARTSPPAGVAPTA